MRKFFRRQEVQAVYSKTSSVTSTVGAETTLKRTGEAKILKSSNLTIPTAILALIMVFGFNATAQTVINQGSCGANLTYVLTSDSVLTISGSGNMTNFANSNTVSWYNYRNNIKTVVIGNTVTSIGNWAFSNCGLTSVIIPNNVTSIGDYAFSNCGLTSVIIPNSITTIGNSIFYLCENLISAVIGNNVTKIEDRGFGRCTKLTSITIPNSVTSIGNYAFVGCGLTSVTIGNSVTSIGVMAFDGCDSIVSITIKAKTPPILGGFAFFPMPTISVYVPCKSYITYTNPRWGGFANFVAMLDTTFYSASICQGSSYTDNNFTTPIYSAGTHYVVIPIGSDCDSVIELSLSYYPSIPLTSYAVKICEEDIYNDVNFNNLTKDSIYYDTLRNVNGCDSVIELTLSYYPNVPITTYAVEICEGGFYTDDNFTNLTKDSIYYDTLRNVNGCDSVIELSLSFYPNVLITTYSDTICSGEIYNDANFNNLTKDSIYYNTLQNINGCDSVIELTLTVNLSDTTLLFDSIQQGETYNKNGFSVSEAGIYTQELQNVYGCDSVVVLHLAITGVGVKQLQGTSYELQVYPNPVNEQLTIKNEELRENSVVEIYDVVGQCVYTTPSFGGAWVVIDVSHLASGMYFLKVDNKVVKFVKE